MTPANSFPNDRSADPLRRIGFLFVAIYLFSVFSACIDLLVFLHPFRPQFFIGMAGLLIATLTGRIGMVVKTQVGATFLVFTCWLIVCIPFSVWPGGSTTVLLEEWQKAALTFFLTAGLLYNWQQCRKIIHVLAGAVVLLSLFALRFNANIDGRLIVPGTRYTNTNDLGMVLVAGLPFLAYVFTRPGQLKKIAALCGSVPVLLCASKTGSRAAMVGMVVMLLAVFIRASMTNKILLIVAVLVAVMVMTVALPGEMQRRYFTIFQAESGELSQTDIAAIQSSYSRKMLFWDSVTLTLVHPIFGVGPGMFPVGQHDLAVARGERRGDWHATHNAYTQVSSETGFPGVILYVGAIYLSFASLRRIGKLKQSNPLVGELKSLATCLRISLLAFCSVACFSSIAYLPHLPILCGLTVGLQFAAQAALEQMEAERRQFRPATPVPVLAGPRAGLQRI
jgi:hypothetical protein